MRKYVGMNHFPPPESADEEHDWVGNSFGPVARLRRIKGYPKKNPGGDVTAQTPKPAAGLIDPWRKRG